MNSDAINILQLGKFYPIRGGVEKVMYEFTKGLGEKGINCDMLCADHETKTDRVIEFNHYSRIICKRAIIKVAATTIAPGMISWLRRHCDDYDIIHIHHPDPMAAFALRFSGYKGKVFLHWHSDIIKQKFFLKFYLPLQTWLLKRADLIIGTTPVYVKESPYLKKYQEKTTYLPIGVDEMIPNSDSVKEIRKRFEGKKLVFSIGRLVEYKGLEYLVEAMAHLSDEYVLALGGQGPLKDNLLNQCTSLGLQDRVVFLDWVSQDDLPAWFGACDIFVLPSIHKTEAFAIVQIEAMSCGKPVVSTRIPGSGVPWVNADGESGITVPVKDPKSLANAISAICSNEAGYEKFCISARNRFERLFTKEKMLSSLLDLYL